MGFSFMDDIQDAVGRGTSAMQKGSRKTQLRLQLNDLARRRRDAVAELGASIYGTVANTPELLAGREELVANIANIDAQKQSIQDEIAQIEAEQADFRRASQKMRCPNCGAEISVASKFCIGCGMSMEDIKAAQAMAANAAAAAAGVLVCHKCGTEVSAGDSFCMGCGIPVDQIKAAAKAAMTEAQIAIQDQVAEQDQAAAQTQVAAQAQVAPEAAAQDVEQAAAQTYVAMQPVQAPAAAQPAVNAPTNDGACRNCGSKIFPGDSFCMHCGMSVEAMSAMVNESVFNPVNASAVMTPTCPTCGNAIALNDSFCMSCGTNVSSVVSAWSAANNGTYAENQAQAQTQAANAGEVAGAPASTQSASFDTPAIPVCSACGTPINDSDKFCGACGNKLL